MKVSGFTFLRNGTLLGYPFLQSIRSALPLCDEFVVNVGPSEDDTLERVRSLGPEKVRIIESRWNEKMRAHGYVYGQQKNIAHFNCTGDWALYLEGDEVLHEDDLPRIRQAMERHLDHPRVEALAFDYLHFYGNHRTYAWSPGWYRRAVRVVRNTLRSYSPDGLYFVILDHGRRGRYPRAALAGATIYHYGWIRSEAQMDRKSEKVDGYWGRRPGRTEYAQIDPQVLRPFTGTHPAVMRDWLPEEDPPVFRADSAHLLTARERKHRLLMRLERAFGLDLSRKHYRLVR